MPSENDVKLVNLLDLKEAYDNSKHVQTAVSSPSASGTAVAFIDSISQDTNGVISPTKKTVAEATQSAAGLMSALDKAKLDGIASGAQVNSVTGVKGNAESTYRTDNVNLTPANIGAVAKSGDTMTGPLKWSGGTALPAASNLQYFLGIDPFADGGTTHYITAANLRNSLSIVGGTKVSIFSGGSASFAPSDIGLAGKPNCLILTLSSNAASNPPTYDTFLSYDWDASTDSMITIRGYRHDGTPIAGYVRYSYLAIP